jgi:hypothetical protein
MASTSADVNDGVFGPHKQWDPAAVDAHIVDD